MLVTVDFLLTVDIDSQIKCGGPILEANVCFKTLHTCELSVLSARHIGKFFKSDDADVYILSL